MPCSFIAPYCTRLSWDFIDDGLGKVSGAEKCFLIYTSPGVGMGWDYDTNARGFNKGPVYKEPPTDLKIRRKTDH